ncbi:hypothetical protein B0T18DRAFT_48169 [Schizothecium vesticola]|uniref:Uncharacterized protein n=1 Tax=Schizothecium vesticola TaxID=314040 RepID=A0AA40FBT6_9PEZI|nr:hypothetical protein B0T18DRAFT_48169 [Schizothecium vesticola]
MVSKFIRHFLSISPLLYFLFFGMKMFSLTGWGDVTTIGAAIDSSRLLLRSLLLTNEATRIKNTFWPVRHEVVIAGITKQPGRVVAVNVLRYCVSSTARPSPPRNLKVSNIAPGTAFYMLMEV